MAELSDRMLKAIEDYNIDGDVLARELAISVKLPAFTWFPAEFEEALLAGAFTTETWGVCYNGGLDPDDVSVVDEDLREFWAAIFPDRPYPLGEPPETE